MGRRLVSTEGSVQPPHVPHEYEHLVPPLQDAVHLYYVRILNVRQYVQLPGIKLLEELLGRLLLVEYLARQSRSLQTIEIISHVYGRVRTLTDYPADVITALLQCRQCISGTQSRHPLYALLGHKPFRAGSFPYDTQDFFGQIHTKNY